MLVVLTAFAAGVVVGVLGMVPRWWKHRSAARRAQAALPAEAPAPAPVAAPAVPDLQQQPPSIHGI